MQQAISLIEQTDSAAALLSPVRLRILELLREPASAAAVARELDLPRQRVTYHVKALEQSGLLRNVGERRRGNFVEKLVQSTARYYLIAPQALGALGPTLDAAQDRFSSAYLVGMVSEAIRDVATLREQASGAGKKLATFSLDTEVRFASGADQSAFAQELSTCLAQLVKKYDDREAEGGRRFRFLLAGYPALARQTAEFHEAEEQDHEES